MSKVTDYNPSEFIDNIDDAKRMLSKCINLNHDNLLQDVLGYIYNSKFWKEKQSQSMETAPKDGTEIIVEVDNGETRVVSWDEDVDYWCVFDGKNWHPLRINHPISWRKFQ